MTIANQKEKRRCYLATYKEKSNKMCVFRADDEADNEPTKKRCFQTTFRDAGTGIKTSTLLFLSVLRSFSGS